MARVQFGGFPPETLKFLRALKRNNDRTWFQGHKDQYDSAFLAPSLAFIDAIGKPLEGISPCLRAVARKTGGSLMRIYRDTRFSKEKTPYKTNIGIHFRHVNGGDVHAPGCYVHIEPGACFLGVGTWRPDATSLAKIRTAISEDPSGWKRASRSKRFAERFELAGDSLKRPPRGFDPDHRAIVDLKRKDLIGVCAVRDEEVLSTDFLEETVKSFRDGRPLMRFLCRALNVPF